MELNSVHKIILSKTSNLPNTISLLIPVINYSALVVWPRRVALSGGSFLGVSSICIVIKQPAPSSVLVPWLGVQQGCMVPGAVVCWSEFSDAQTQTIMPSAQASCSSLRLPASIYAWKWAHKENSIRHECEWGTVNTINSWAECKKMLCDRGCISQSLNLAP